MSSKDVWSIVVLFCGMTLLACVFYHVYETTAPFNTSSPYESMVDEDQLIEENFDPGKKAAYQNAKRFLSYAKDGSGFSAKALRLELEAMGYSEKEVAYAINKIPESTYVKQIVKMINHYKDSGKELTKKQAYEMWTDIGFSKKEIDAAFDYVEEKEGNK